jgi:hypothetical protein
MIFKEFLPKVEWVKALLGWGLRGFKFEIRKPFLTGRA